MAAMAREPGCSFESSDSRQTRDWQRRHGGGQPLTLTAEEQKLAAALRDGPPAPAPQAGPDPEPAALARVIPPARPEPDEDGKRDCARGTWCSSAAVITEGGAVTRIPERGYQPFCPKDRRVLETDLSQIPAQFAHLAAEIGNPARNGQVIRVPFGPRIPIRLDVDTLMRAIVESLASWHERVADTASLSYPYTRLSRFQRQMVAVRDAERVLIHRVDALLALEAQPMDRTRRVVTERDPKGRATEDVTVTEFLDGTDAGMEIFTLRYLCRAVLGETRAKPEELFGVPCRVEDCDRLALRRAELPSDPDAPVWWSECSACGDRLTEEEYRDWTVRYARWAQGRPVPVLENLPGVA
jgi:hypothetical protein